MKAKLSKGMKGALAVLILAVFAIVSAGEAQAAYMIQSKLSGQYLDIRGQSTKSGAELITWDRTGRSNQQFRVYVEEGESYTISPVHSNLYLSPDSDGAIRQFRSETYWFLQKQNDGWYKITDGNGLYWDVQKNSTKRGTSIILYKRKNSNDDNQKFRFIEING